MAADDPRQYSQSIVAPPSLARLYSLATQSLDAATRQTSLAFDGEIRAALDSMLRSGDGQSLARLFELAPSGSVYRHLWRLLANRERMASIDAALEATVFAIPIVIVAGQSAPLPGPTILSGVVPAIGDLADLLRTHGALAGNETFALGNVLVAAETLGFTHLPELEAWRDLSVSSTPPRVLEAAPIVVAPGPEGAHLRFLVGSALAAPGVNLLGDDNVGAWGAPFAQALSRQLADGGLSLLALPRAPRPPLIAVVDGQNAQRDIAAQLFASNAIRKLRAAVGEPIAVISVHRVGERGAEIRLSLSSPFDPREAEGFRWPLLPLDQVDDVTNTLRDLLRDCRVTDIRIEPGIHADCDPATGLTLFFKGDSGDSGDSGHARSRVH